MAKIAVDIDSTLYDFETPAREAFFKLWEETGDTAFKEAAYHPWTEWRSPNDVLGTERWLEAIALCHEEDVILGQTPFKGAVETCQALANEGHDLLYISTRDTESTDATDKWLERNGFYNTAESGGNIDLSCSFEDKIPLVRDCQYMIDDRLKTVVQFVYDIEWLNGLTASYDGPDVDGSYDEYWEAHRRRAFVKAYPYNQGATDIPGLYLAPTWAGLNVYLVSKGVLSEPAATPSLTT